MTEKFKNKKKNQIINTEDLKVIYRIFFKNWYFFVLAPLALASLAFFYTHRMTDIYAANTQILLKSQETYNYQERIYQNIGYMGVYADITQPLGGVRPTVPKLAPAPPGPSGSCRNARTPSGSPRHCP